MQYVLKKTLLQLFVLHLSVPEMDSEVHPMESPITGLCCICLSVQEMYGQ